MREREMRHKSALSFGIISLCGLLLALAAMGAHAQFAFTNDDWTLDRGALTLDANNNGLALRQGYNNFTDLANQPFHGLPRWVWPTGVDLLGAQNGGSNQTSGVSALNPIIVDNPPGFPGNKEIFDPNVTQNALSVWNTNVFTVPPIAQRVPQAGFSFGTDPTDPNNFDYGIATPQPVTITYTGSNGSTVTATTDQLTQLPYVPPQLYAAVNNALNNAQPVAQWTMGNPILPTALQGVTLNYTVSIWSPGDGTLDANDVPHPDLKHAFVRVSWFHTVNGNTINNTGTPGGGGVYDVVNSRIYMIDLSGGPGWRVIGPYAASSTTSVTPAVFPYNSNDPTSQIVVTLYVLTPDNPNDTSLYLHPPYVTADAVEFVPLGIANTGNNGGAIAQSPLGPISAQGRILAPVVGSNKVVTNPNDPEFGKTVYYVAREEAIANTPPTSPVDPTQTPLTPGNDAYTTFTVPVFYCLNNEDGIQIVNGQPQELPSKTRVRWRYVALPDAGTGTCTASPLLANVRCRDGKVRPMVYFVTTAAGGALGHIYALDPVGNNPFGPDPGDLSTRTTTAYWVYPSVRPLLGTANEPPNAPAQWEDPNFSLPANTGAYSRTGYPAFSFGPDQPTDSGGHLIYDGDIIPNPNTTAAATTPYIVRNDTLLTMTGMTWTPTLVDDPDNPNGPQLLIVTAQGSDSGHGRVYAFDAGGRGDFGTINVNNQQLAVAGTTQRIWTWPRFGADTFHRVNTPSATGGFNMADNFSDEPQIGFLAGSPMYDPNYAGGTAEKPLVVGASDGHVYAILAHHDTVPNVNGTQVTYDNTKRLYWTYPSTAGPGLGAAPSTVAFYQPTGSNNRYLVFTCDTPDGGGRVYALPEATPNGQTVPFTNQLTWVFPPTPDPPNPDPNNPNGTAPFVPGFGGNAPVPVNSGLLPQGTLPSDVIYVVQSDGTVDGIQVDGNGLNPKLYATNIPQSGFVFSSPIIAQLQADPSEGLLDGTTLSYNVPYPCLVYSDDTGNFYGVGLQAYNDGNGNIFLPLIWNPPTTSGSVRSAASALINSYIVEGDEGGQVTAFTNGTGNNGLVSPLPSVELRGGGNDQSLVDIDIRGVDYFAQNVWNTFWPNGTTGTPFSANALVGQVPDGTNGLAVDWGDHLYVAAWGVYHAEPQQPGLTAYGTAPPRITVTFRIDVPRGNRTITVQVPATTANGQPAGWPGDAGAGNQQFTIWGDDPNNPPPNSQNGASGLLTGPTHYVFPWVAVASIPIQPDANNPVAPGISGYRVSARAHIEQNVVYKNGNQTINYTPARFDSPLFFGGQRDVNGADHGYILGNLSRALQSSPNNIAARGRPRRVYITNPLALTVAGTNPSGSGSADQTGSNIFNIIGWAPAADNPNITINNIAELLGNGAQTGWIGNFGVKSLFAPLDMAVDGNSVQYRGIDANGNRVPAFYVEDRSAYQLLTGSPLNIIVQMPSLVWWGGPSSVMNPLPWEQLPGDGTSTPDYPAIAASNVSIVGQNGVDATRAALPLPAPALPSGDNNVADRNPTPEQLNLTVNVPKYQPANVNRGIVQTAFGNFGDSFTNEAGQVLGALGSPVLGPIRTFNDGQPPTTPGTGTFPALGYIAQRAQVVVQLPGRPLRPGVFNGYNRAEIEEARRQFNLGMCVAPSFRLHVEGAALDFGNVPAGTGYSPVNNNGVHSIPFAPTGTAPYANTVSPWDDPKQFGEFFQPFTLMSDSNVNLVDLRIATLIGQPGSTFSAASLAPGLAPSTGAAVAQGLQSDQVDQLFSSWLLAPPFGSANSPIPTPGTGNIGIVSSFDHPYNNGQANLSDILFYPIPNPFWTPTNGLQPYPTLHKPLPGDAQGTVATIPDVPHGYVPSGNGLKPQPPKLGIAVPLGTPVGTYVGTVVPYEDEMPLQWREWLATSGSNYGSSALAGNDDDILNTNPVGQALEAYANPDIQVKVTVVPNRLTGGTTQGSLSQIDTVNFAAPNNLGKSSPSATLPTGFNMLPAAVLYPASDNTSGLYLYWASNSLRGNTAPGPTSPSDILYSWLTMPYLNLGSLGGVGYMSFAQFGQPNQQQWWNPMTPLLDITNTGLLQTFFPSTGDNTVPGTPIPGTVQFASPAIATANDVDANGNITVGPPSDNEAYLFFAGQVQKQTAPNQEVTEMRFFWQPLSTTYPYVPQGTPNFVPGNPYVPKYDPAPLLVKLAADSGRNVPAQKLLYLFYSVGRQDHTQIYYNFNLSTSLNGSISQAGWQPDGILLPTPITLGQQSHPSAIYRRVYAQNPFNTSSDVRVFDAIDLYFTGVLPGRGDHAETLMIRYGIYRGENLGPNAPAMVPGQLFVLPLPPVTDETLTRAGATNHFVSRDVGWYIGYNNQQPFSNVQPYISLERIDQNGNVLQLLAGPGTFDPASQTITYNSALGGRIVVDPQSGIVRFPDVPPKSTDIVRVSYIPQVMRLNTSRDDSNLVVAGGYGNIPTNPLPPAFQAHPAVDTVGINTAPEVLLDRSPNPRQLLTNPTVVFDSKGNPLGANGPAMLTDRLWLFYHKTDVTGKTKSAVYFKTMRLMIKLPYPVAVAKNNNGVTQIVGLTVTGARGPYEVDWQRGRIYFTEADEGNQVQVAYTYYNPATNTTANSGTLTYQVAWGDEMSDTLGNDVYEAPLPVNGAVNEGQIAVLKDPLMNRLWVFWASTRAGTTDLYMAALAPKFYPDLVGQ